MTDLAPLLEDPVTANRILVAAEIVDSFGHISVRHPPILSTGCGRTGAAGPMVR